MKLLYNKMTSYCIIIKHYKNIPYVIYLKSKTTMYKGAKDTFLLQLLTKKAQENNFKLNKIRIRPICSSINCQVTITTHFACTCYISKVADDNNILYSTRIRSLWLVSKVSLVWLSLMSYLFCYGYLANWFLLFKPVLKCSLFNN